MTNIGIFDSGLGGVAVLNEISKNNKANYFYLGDNLRVPYGNRPREEIKNFACQIVDFLENYDIDYYIIACNTISVTCKDYLADRFKKKFIPITDIALKAAKDKPGDYLVLATKATIESHFYKKSLEEVTNDKVYEQKAYKLVDLIESGILNGDELDRVLDEYLAIANDKKIENILLACTHYPIIKDEIIKRLSYDANVIDPAKFLSSEIETNDKEKKIKMFLSKKSAKTEELISQIMESDYEINYIGELK